MQRNHEQIRNTSSRQAFTLVELLIVGAIIVILIALTFIVIRMAIAASKETKTRATIQKLDTAILQIFETYESRFAAIQNKLLQDFPALPDELRQKIATHFIRDLMRMEMPQHWAEVYDSNNPGRPLGPIKITLNRTAYAVDKSALLDYYWGEYNRAATSGNTPSRAALLFLIIQNLNPEALEAFHGSEVAVGDDGLFMFVDAWGNPIRFLRWAPALTGSALQPDVLAMTQPKYVPDTNINANRNWWGAREPQLLDAMISAKNKHRDPLDDWGSALGWFLYPVIYSAGPDGQYGLDEGDGLPPTVGNDGILDPFAFPYGMPTGSSHFDNIHNHQWYRSF